MSALAAAAVLAMAALPECGAGEGIPPDRMLAVATVESSRDPLTIGVNGPNPTTLHLATKEAAVAKAQELLGQGKSIDLGLLQINSANLALHRLTIETAFDACQSLRAGAEHLAADYQAAWRAAHSRYNTGDLQRGIANGYAAKVEHTLVKVTAELGTSPSPADPGRPASVAQPGIPAWDLFARARTGAASLLPQH